MLNIEDAADCEAPSSQLWWLNSLTKFVESQVTVAVTYGSSLTICNRLA